MNNNVLKNSSTEHSLHAPAVMEALGTGISMLRLYVVLRDKNRKSPEGYGFIKFFKDERS